MPLLSTVYCTTGQLQRYLSTNAVTDYADHDNDNTADTDVVEDCINQATEEIDLYARQQYKQSDLDDSQLIERWCVVMSAYFLCQRRGNVIPGSIADEFERIADPDNGFLARVADGRRQLPGVSKREDLRPTFSNLTVDQRHNRSTIRRTPDNSSDAPTKLSRDDMREVSGTDFD